MYNSCTCMCMCTSIFYLCMYILCSVSLIKEAEITLIEVIHTMLKDGNLKFGQLVRNALVEKLNQKVPEFIPLSFAMCKKSSGYEYTSTITFTVCIMHYDAYAITGAGKDSCKCTYMIMYKCIVFLCV